jgi:hypothetical protein
MKRRKFNTGEPAREFPALSESARVLCGLRRMVFGFGRERRETGDAEGETVMAALRAFRVHVR